MLDPDEVRPPDEAPPAATERGATDQERRLKWWVDVSTIAQNITLSLAAILGGWWAIATYFMDGSHVDGVDITLDVETIRTPGGFFALAATATLRGSHRRGHEYDASHAFLSVCRVDFGEFPGLDLVAVGRVPVTEQFADPDGQITATMVTRTHMSSLRSSRFAFLAPVQTPGLYQLTFVMPDAGIEGDRPAPPGYFVGDTVTRYVLVEQAPQADAPR